MKFPEVIKVSDIPIRWIDKNLVSIQMMPPPTGVMLPFINIDMGQPSGYRSGTFFTCVATGDVFMHNGWKSGDGLGVVMMWRKDKLKKPDSRTHRIEWSTGMNNFMYGGEVRLSTAPEIEDFVRDLIYEGDSKIYYGQ